MTIIVWLILCLIWGTTWIFIKIGLEDLPPITFAAARFLLSLAILLPIIKWQGYVWPRSISEWKLMAYTGFLQFSLNYSTVFWAEQYISSGLAAVLQAIITVFGLLLAWIYLPNEIINRWKVAAIFIGLAGVGIIFIDQLRFESRMAFIGSVVIVVGAFAAAKSSILVKAKAGGIQPAMILFTQMLCGIPLIIIYALAAEGSPLNINWSPKAIFSVVYLTVAGTIAAFWLYYWLLARVESTKAMMISLVTPLIAVLIGAIFLDESLPPQTIFGALLILASISLIIYKK